MVTNDDVVFVYSGGIDNDDPTASIGGAPSQVVGTGNVISGQMDNVWNDVSKGAEVTGIVKQYRCLYITNNDDTDKIKKMRLYLDSINRDTDVQISIGLDPAGRNGTAATIADDTTDPTGVTFSVPKSYDTGLDLGDMAAGDVYPFWIKRSVKPNAKDFYADAYILRAQGFPAAFSIPSHIVITVGLLGCKSDIAKKIIKSIEDRLNLVPQLSQFLALGGLSFATTAKCWFDITVKIDKFINIVFGAPEVNSTFGKQPDLKRQYHFHYGRKHSYYSYDIQNIHFIHLSTEIDYGKTSAQYKFVSNDLAAVSKRADIDFIVAATYQPFYSMAGQTDIPPFTKSSFRAAYLPLFDQYNVDLVLSSHVRNYQRTKQLTYNSGTDSPVVTGFGLHYYTQGTGRIFADVGTGGEFKLDTDPVSPLPSYYAYAENTDYGYLALTWSFNSVTKVHTLVGTFTNIDGQPMDFFQVTKKDS